MRDFLWKLWMTTFHLDSRALRTLWTVLSPGKLTIAYFAGKQKKFFHPIQFFFLSLFAVILMASLSNKGGSLPFQLFEFFPGKEAEYIKAQLDMRDTLLHYRDSIPANWRTPVVHKSVDSLMQLVSTKIATHQSDSFTMNMTGRIYAFSYKDMLHLTPDSLIEFYQIRPGFDRILVRQIMKSGLHAQELGRFWVGSISWSLLVLVVVMAFWLKILYYRKKRYYVEHFVLMLHLQTGLLVVLTISMALRLWLHFPKSVILLSVLWLTVGYFIAFKRYYQQRFWRTFLKWFLFQFLYFFSFFVVLLGSMAFAVLMF